MFSQKKSWLAGVVALVMLLTLVSASCTNSATGSDLKNSNVTRTGGTESVAKTLAQMLGDVATGVGQVATSKEVADSPRFCLLEEKHTSVAGQLEVALMLLRLHDRYGLRDIALEGLTKDQAFPSTKWFQEMGGAGDTELRNQIAVGLLRQGEISAVELIALAFPDVTVHPADDPAAYAVEMTKRAGVASVVYLYKIGLKSVRPEHYARIQQLGQQQKSAEVIEYIISLDPWAKERFEQMKKDTSNSIEQTQRVLKEIEDRATAVGADIGSDDRSAMSDAKAFFDAAVSRTRIMVQTTLEIGKKTPVVALNLGAAHTEGTRRMFDEVKATYGVLTPLSLATNLKAGDLSYESFERKNKQQSVAFSGKGLGSLLDGRRKPSPVVATRWFRAESELRYATVLLARAATAGGPNFPDSNLRANMDRLEDVKVNWATVKKDPNGDVSFTASVLGEKGWSSISARCGMPKGVDSFVRLRGQTLEQLLTENLDDVRKETGERKEPPKGPVVEMVTPDVLAVYDKEPQALANVRISG